MTNQLARIERLAKQVPSVSEAARKQLEAGNQIEMQKALGQAPAAPTSRLAQAIAPQVASQSANTALSAGANAQKQLTDLSKAYVSTQGAQADNDLNQRRIGLEESASSARMSQGLELGREDLASQSRMSRDNAAANSRISSLGMEQDNRMLRLSIRQNEELAGIGRDIKGKIFDGRLQFEKDEAGRRFSNERQLADYRLANAKTEIAFQDTMREMTQANDKATAVLERASQQLSVALERGFLTDQQSLDYEHKKYLIQMKADMEKLVAKRKAKSNNNRQIAVGVGTVVGAVVGTVFLTPGAGTAIGATVGAGAGAAIHGGGAQAGWWD